MSNLYNQKHYALLFKNMTGRHLHIKIDLFNDKDVKIDSFEGITTSGGINLSSDSTYRRTGNLSMILNKLLLPKPENKIWFNKRIKINIGLSDFNDEIYWYDMGKFAIDKVSAKSSQADKSLEMNLLDYVAFLDGVLGGYLSHETQLTAKLGIPIRDAIITTLSSLPKVMIDNITVEGLEALIPYDMTFNPNGTIFDIVKQILELYMGYEGFFDIDGAFRVQKIRDRKNDSIAWDFTIDNMDLSIDYVNEINMGNVKNSLHVWGNTSESTGIQTYWVYRNRWSRKKYDDLINLTDKQKGDICFLTEEGQSYMWNGNNWGLLDFNVVPIFNIESIGEKIWSYSDNKIFNEMQAKLRCEFELTNQSNFAETISISSVPIFLLDVNSKIKLENFEAGISGEYIIETISVPLDISSPMNITARKLYY